MKRIIVRVPNILCYLVAFVSGMKQLREPDIWWQLLSGRWMLEHGQVTHKDVFSYTMAGNPWTNVKWLYEVLIALLEKATGPLGVILLQSLVNVAIVYLLFQCIRLLANLCEQPVSRFFSVVSVLLFIMVVEYRMAGRPEMFSHLLCTLYLYVILRSVTMEWKNIFWLVPLQCLWANMHDGYPVGLVMAGCCIAGFATAAVVLKDKTAVNKMLRAVLLFAAMVLVILLNPNGIVLWKQPFEIYRQVWANKYTTELYSFTTPEYWTLQGKIHATILLLVVIFWTGRLLAMRRNRQRISPVLITYLLMIVLFGYLSLTANRNIPFAQIILLPSVPAMFTGFMQFIKATKWPAYTRLGNWSPWVACALGVVCYVAIVSNAYYKATGSPNRYGIHVNMLHNPVGAADFIKQYHISGTAFSDYFVSSYLLWDLFPAYKSYIDLRDLDVFPADFFEQYFNLYEHSEKFSQLDSQYHFNYVVLSTSQLLKLQHNLYWKTGYNMVYADPVSVIYLKQNDSNKALNTNAAIQKPFSWPQAPAEPGWAAGLNKILNPAYNNAEEDETKAPIYAALFYSNMQDYPQAVKMLKPALPGLEDDPMAAQTMAGVYSDYAQVTTDPRMKQLRLDSAEIYRQQAAK